MAPKSPDNRAPTGVDRWLSHVFDAGTGDGRRTDVVPWTHHEKLVVRRWIAATMPLCLVGFGCLLAAGAGASPTITKPILAIVTAVIILIAVGMAIAMLRARRRARR